MTPTPLDLYQRGLSATLSAPDGARRGVARAWRARGEDGSERPLDLERWVGDPTPAEEALLDAAVGPVLDVGCGPGRHVAALRRRGVAALGLDISPLAVRIARRRGAPVLHRSVFDEVPHAGRWATALLLDGNLGIGGDPVAVLRRVGSLLRSGGGALVEADLPGARSAIRMRTRIVGPEGASQWFSWAHVAADRLAEVARAGGFEVDGCWQREGRCFARLALAP